MYNFDDFNKKMQEGYEKFYSDNEKDACTIWLEAWKIFLNLIDSNNIKSIEDFDKRLRSISMEFTYNWIQDFDLALGNAGIHNNNFYQERIEFCKGFLHRFENTSDELVLQNIKRAMGDSYFLLGQRDEAESLFEKWLKEDPRWGWGWIGWADCWYFYSAKEKDDFEKAIRIMQKGLEVEDVSDKEDIYERIADIYRDMGLSEEADHVEEIRNSYLNAKKSKKKHNKATASFAPKPQEQAVIEKIGRNEPCSCGSGKKYKKCCGK